MPMTPERVLFLQGGNAAGDSGLILSTDAKPRLKWTPDLQAVLEKAQDTLGRQNLGTVGLEAAAKVRLSEPVSTNCLNSALPGMKDVSGGFCPQQKQTNLQSMDFSLDSCFTSCGDLIPLASKIDNDTFELRWCKDLKEIRKKEVDACDLSMSIGVQGEKLNGNRIYTGEEFRNTKRRDSVKPHNEEIAQGFQLNNIHENNDPPSRRKQFDLNGFSCC